MFLFTCLAYLRNSGTIISYRKLYNNSIKSLAAVMGVCEVTQCIKGEELPEGKGVTVLRSIGSAQLKYLDPFLLLDDFRVTPPAGFPPHPHRGFETVTYMLKGAFKHEDFKGHKGVINAGDLQWMTAGRGIVHSELPATPGENVGLQLWVNLVNEHKMGEPQYQELLDAYIPRVERDGVWCKVIAGDALGVKASVRTRTPVSYLHYKLQPSARTQQVIPEGWNAFSYIINGAATFGGPGKETTADTGSTVVFSAGNEVIINNKSSDECEFVLIFGKPIGEPISRRRGMIMTTAADVEQAIKDFEEEKNGFENAQTWKKN